MGDASNGDGRETADGDGHGATNGEVSEVTNGAVRVALFRPDDERLSEGVSLLESLGATAVPDPMLEVQPTGEQPRADADYVIFTSKTGVELVADENWSPGTATVCAIGDRTATALRDAGYAVDLVPDEFTSEGLVAALADDVDGERVEIARSGHGRSALVEGLERAGATVHETILYELGRPRDSGRSAVLAAAGQLDGALFSSSRTVEHFLEAADERGIRDRAVAGLADAVVGVIGEPTRETAERHGIAVDVVPDAARFDALARAVVDRCSPIDHE